MPAGGSLGRRSRGQRSALLRRSEPARVQYHPALPDRLHHRRGPGLAIGTALGFSDWGTIGLATARALALWLANRTIDGLDGAVARLRGATDLGGMLDFLADFVVYAGFPVAVAVATADARLAVAALLAAYLLNNVALLSFSSISEKRGIALGGERSLRFTPGLTEGTETIVCYALVCLIPDHAGTIFWIFTALVMVTVAQRVALAVRMLG